MLDLPSGKNRDLEYFYGGLRDAGATTESNAADIHAAHLAYSTISEH